MDVISVLTDSPRPRKYWNALKVKLIEEGSELSSKLGQLKLNSKDGKLRETDVLDTEGIFRLIESVPSKNAEPFKLWLAKLGRQEVDNVFDSSKGIDKMIDYYLKKGYTLEYQYVDNSSQIENKQVIRMKQIKHIGVYGLIINDNKILLIKKNGGPYDGKLDLPGGTIEFNENIEEALIRELKEEVGIEVTSYKLFDVVTTNIKWNYKDEDVETKHIAILYKINKFKNEIKDTIEITEINDDSMGAEYYDINLLTKEQLSNIAILALEKL